MAQKTAGMDGGPAEPPAALPVVKVDGVAIPALFEEAVGRPLPEHFALLKDMELQDDDVILMAFGKAGTHWIWEILSMLRTGKAEFEKRSKEFVMMEATAIETLQAETSPRVFNSHLPLRMLPRQILDKKVKVVHVYRNVKDVFVSGYYHVRQMPESFDVTLDMMEKVMFGENAPMGDYFTYLKELDQDRKNNPDHPFFNMSYEDTKENPEKMVRSLAQFLGVKASDQLCADIAQATSFHSMKQADKDKDHPGIANIQMYRKGQVGDWKNHMTVAMSERFDAAMTQLASCDYNFRYTL